MKTGQNIAVPLLLAAASFITGVSACRRHPQTHPGEPVVASLDDSLLTLRRVLSRIPVGLSSDDSLELANKIIDGWIEDRLFEAYISIDPSDERRIERMVEDYRRKLRLEAYRTRMRRENNLQINADSIRAYYDAHLSEMICERPLVKGLFVKVDTDSQETDRYRSLVNQASADDIEALESSNDASLLSVDYFGETWVEFDVIASEIPFRFGDPNEFLKKNKNFETSDGKNVYLLHIYDFVPQGQSMPYEFASVQIQDILQESRLEAYRRGLLKALRLKAEREGRLNIEK